VNGKQNFMLMEQYSNLKQREMCSICLGHCSPLRISVQIMFLKILQLQKFYTGLDW